MILATCPFCQSENKDERATGSSSVHSVYREVEDTRSFTPPVFEVLELECEHCKKTIFVVMVDERW